MSNNVVAATPVAEKEPYSDLNIADFFKKGHESRIDPEYFKTKLKALEIVENFAGIDECSHIATGNSKDYNAYGCCEFLSKNHFVYRCRLTKKHPIFFYRDYVEMLNENNFPHIMIDEELTTPRSKYVHFIVDNAIMYEDDKGSVKQVNLQATKINRLLPHQFLRFLHSSWANGMAETLLKNYKKYKETATFSEILVYTSLCCVSKSINNTYSPVYLPLNTAVGLYIPVLFVLKDNYADSYNADILYNKGAGNNINPIHHLLIDPYSQHAPTTSLANFKCKFYNAGVHSQNIYAHHLFYVAMFYATDGFADLRETLNLWELYSKVMTKLYHENNVRKHIELTERNIIEVFNNILNS